MSSFLGARVIFSWGRCVIFSWGSVSSSLRAGVSFSRGGVSFFQGAGLSFMRKLGDIKPITGRTQHITTCVSHCKGNISSTLQFSDHNLILPSSVAQTFTSILNLCVVIKGFKQTRIGYQAGMNIPIQENLSYVPTVLNRESTAHRNFIVSVKYHQRNCGILGKLKLGIQQAIS